MSTKVMSAPARASLPPMMPRWAGADDDHAIAHVNLP